MVAVTHEKLRQRCLIALRNPVAAPKRPGLHVSRAYDERVADKLTCRKSPEGVWCPCGRVWPAVHPDDSVSFRCLRPEVNRQQPLRTQVALFPDAEVAERAHLVGREIRLTLVMTEGHSGRVVGKRPQPAGLVEWKAAVVGQLGPGSTLHEVLVERRRPIAS
jgi:hypothetical protein